MALPYPDLNYFIFLFFQLSDFSITLNHFYENLFTKGNEKTLFVALNSSTSKNLLPLNELYYGRAFMLYKREITFLFEEKIK